MLTRVCCMPFERAGGIHICGVIPPKPAGTTSCLSPTVADNGAELTSVAILKWTQTSGAEWHNIATGKPQQNALWRASSVDCAMRA